MKPTLLRSLLTSFVFTASITTLHALAQVETKMLDEAVGLTTSFDDEVAWQAATDQSNGESASCAVIQKGEVQEAILCIKTALKKSKSGLEMAALDKLGLKLLSAATCKAYQCLSPDVDGGSEEIKLGIYHGFLRSSTISHPAYKELGLVNIQYFVAHNQFGQKVTFELLTQKEQASKYQSVFESAINNAVYRAN